MPQQNLSLTTHSARALVEGLLLRVTPARGDRLVLPFTCCGLSQTLDTCILCRHFIMTSGTYVTIVLHFGWVGRLSPRAIPSTGTRYIHDQESGWATRMLTCGRCLLYAFTWHRALTSVLFLVCLIPSQH